MKKSAIIGVILTLILVFILLFGLQVSYYNKVISIRKEQTKQLTQETLRDVAKEVELGELVRYLNNEVRYNRLKLTPNTAKYSTPSPFGLISSEDNAVLLWRLGNMQPDKQSCQRRLDPDNEIQIGEQQIPSEELLRTFAFYRENLDNVLLRYVYENYDLDSIPQLVNPYFIRTTLRRLLDERGICESFHMELFNADGQSLYSYTQPGMLRNEGDLDTRATQKLFDSSGNPDARSPYIQVMLSISPTETEAIRFAIFGFIISGIVLVLGIFSIVLLVRQVSFHRERTNFINNMTHELKTPVSSITLASEMLHSENISEAKGRKMLSVIETEATRLKYLIDKVLQFSVFDGRTGAIDLKLIEINEIILPVAEIYAVHAEQKNGYLDLALEADQTWVKANNMHLTNVIFNLLDNAVKYSKPNQPLLLRIATYNKDGWIYIEVIDNGIGIPKSDLKKIFNRFYRVSTGHKHDVKGFGLGLAYVASVIHQFKGKITAENIPTGGLKIIVGLPTQN